MDQEVGSAIIAVVQLVFTIALLPTVFNRRAQIPRTTSGLTAAGLWVIAFVYAGLELNAALWAAALAALAWTFIFIYRPVR